MRVRYTERAATELGAILDFLRDRSPAGAKSVSQAILRATRLMASFPESGAETDVPEVREMSVPRHPYKLYYAIAPDAVWIVHVRDARREPWPTGTPEVEDLP